MPQKKKKYNARFPPGRIKKIMQTDEEVGKVAAAVPIMISRTLEMFVESLLVKTMEITNARQARTLSPSHMKQCIMAESRFDFLRELVKDVPNISWTEDYLGIDGCQQPPSDVPLNLSNGGSRSSAIHGQQPPPPPPPAESRPKRNYQRPASFDSPSTERRHSQRQADMVASSCSIGSMDESPTGILKRKLLDPSRKSSSADGGGGSGFGKFSRLDSSPASFGLPIEEQSEQTKRRRRSNDGPSLATVPESPLSLLRPTVNITQSFSSPIIKIDYSQPAAGAVSVPGSAMGASQITPIINIDFSQLVSPVTVPATVQGNNNNNHNKLVLNTAAIDQPAISNNNSSGATSIVLTPNLTTPTRLNYAPFPPPSTALSTAGLELDEDYDNI